TPHPELSLTMLTSPQVEVLFGTQGKAYGSFFL
ncbi:MAG: hypothetical protein ACI95K_001007, partial [Lentimonas sp.]